MPDPKKPWLVADKMMRGLPQEDQERFLVELALEHDCLIALVLATQRHKIARSMKAVEEIERSLAEHGSSCKGQCLHNVLMARETDPDPKRRWGYDILAERAMIAKLELWGGRHEVRHTPQGEYFYVTPPLDAEPSLLPPYSRMEVFRPSDPSQASHVVLEVDSRKLYEDPRPLLQWLDETAAADVKTYAPFGGDLCWGSIAGGDEMALRVRWNGQEKVLAPGWSLHDRYAGLLRTLAGPAEYKETGPVATAGPADRTAVTLKLRDLALKYDGRSRFAGYVAKTVRFREIDAFRRGLRDPVTQAESLSPEPNPQNEGLGTSSPGEIEVPDERAWSESESLDHIDRKRVLEVLRNKLSPQQQTILEMKLKDLPVQDIADRLDIQRETVSRHWTRIRRIAGSLD